MVSHLGSQIEQRCVEVLEWVVRVAEVAEAGDHELANGLRGGCAGLQCYLSARTVTCSLDTGRSPVPPCSARHRVAHSATYTCCVCASCCIGDVRHRLACFVHQTTQTTTNMRFHLVTAFEQAQELREEACCGIARSLVGVFHLNQVIIRFLSTRQEDDGRSKGHAICTAQHRPTLSVLHLSF